MNNHKTNNLKKKCLCLFIFNIIFLGNHKNILSDGSTSEEISRKLRKRLQNCNTKDSSIYTGLENIPEYITEKERSKILSIHLECLKFNVQNKCKNDIFLSSGKKHFLKRLRRIKKNLKKCKT